MALSLMGVAVQADSFGNARHLEHVQTPFRPDGADAMTPEALAAHYVREAATVYRIPTDWLGRLETKVDTRKPTASLTADARPSRDELALAHVKTIMGTTIVSFVQLRDGLPVWEAGVSVTVQSRPVRVTSSQSTLHLSIDSAAPSNAALVTEVEAKNAAKLLHAGGGVKINHVRPLVYQYDERKRIDPEADPKADPKKPHDDHGLAGGPPTLPLPALSGFETGKHYVVTEVLFTSTVVDMGEINWRAFVDLEKSAVLYLRAFVAHATGSVFVRDPLTTSGGTLPGSPLAVLNPLRSYVTLDGITPPVPPAPFSLTGTYVRLADVSPPAIAPPQTPDGNFVYDANTDNFSAVNAYYHCHALFQFMEETGFDVFAFFDGTVANPGFPIPVDHRALGNVVNAQGPGNIFGDGSNGFRFALAQLGTSVGIADDPRVVAHEFCHALLWDSVHSPNFGFAHSAGDGLGAILSDPGTLAPDRFLTFPWIAAANAWATERRHDRPVGGGWAWGGIYDFGGYYSEQILGTTMFRVYRAAGGDSGLPNPTERLQAQRDASRWIAYLIIRGIGSLATSPITPSPTPNVYATALMNADAGTIDIEGKPGGLVHKVVRWAFEQQGLYQAPGAPTPVVTKGAPPDVDVYIDDGRAGEYLPYLDDVGNTTEIWNRRTNALSSSPLEHEAPIVGAANYLFVRVKNRGTNAATNVVVRGYRARPGSGRVWPADWTPLTTAQLAAADILPGANAIVGPFAWTPRHTGDEVVLFEVSATGDLSNLDPASFLPSASGPTPDELAVRLDNNLAERRFATVSNPDPCAVEIPEIDPCCISPCPPPWLSLDECMIWYDARVFPIERIEVDRQSAVSLELRVTYEHCSRLRGRQQGRLLFTTTLLPGEQVSIYQMERYRRTRSASETVSIHSSLRQYVSAVHEARSRDTSEGFQKFVENVQLGGNADLSFAALFSVSFSGLNLGTGVALERSASVSHIAEDFAQTVRTASALVEHERSITVSTYEDRETQDITRRTFKNDNQCYAVTYFVRRVMETFKLSTRVAKIEWRLLVKGQTPTPWRLIEDTNGVPAAVAHAIELAAAKLPKVGSVAEADHSITVPTDGTVYESELAHCPSCEPERRAEHQIDLEKRKAEAHKACLEAQLLELEAKRRQALLDAGKLDPFEPPKP